MVRNSLVNRLTSLTTLWFFIASLVTGGMPSALLAQQPGSADFESPIIEHTVQDGGVIGGVEVFGATVVDNDDIKDVSLFYRFSGETQFAELAMREIAASSFYSVKVDTANVPRDTKAIEYYLQAVDVTGNIVLKGFAFQPLIRNFTIPEPASAPAATSRAASGIAESRKLNWVYFAAGVLLVGTIAVALDDGGDGVPRVDDCAGGCPVEFTFPELL